MDRPEDRLALIETFERDGRIGRVLDVWEWPVRLGRAMDNHIVLDDPFVAPHHAMLTPHVQGGVLLQVLQTRNGVVVEGRRHPARSAVRLPLQGAVLQLGASRLRLRLPDETLAPEKVLPQLTAGGRWGPALLATLLMVLALVEHAIGQDPGADFTAWLPTLVGLPAVLLLWCGAWALASKLFQHRFDFAGHFRIALPWLLGLQALSMLLPQVAAALGWPLLWRASGPLSLLLGALLVRAHLAHVLPLHPRAVTAAVASAVLVGSGISLALTHRATDSFSRAPYMSTLPMPAFNFTRPAPTSALVADMGRLGPPLAARVEKARAREATEGVEELDE